MKGKRKENGIMIGREVFIRSIADGWLLYGRNYIVHARLDAGLVILWIETCLYILSGTKEK